MQLHFAKTSISLPIYHHLCRNNKIIISPKRTCVHFSIAIRVKKAQQNLFSDKQGWIHDKTFADGWAGAVKQKLLAIQDCEGPTDRHSKV